MDSLNWMFCLQKVDNTTFRCEGQLMFLPMISQTITWVFSRCTAIALLSSPSVISPVTRCLTKLYSLKSSVILVSIFNVIVVWNYNWLASHEMSPISHKVKERQLSPWAMHPVPYSCASREWGEGAAPPMAAGGCEAHGRRFPEIHLWSKVF